MNWITGINRDGWPTAIPIDRVKQISVHPFGSVDPELCENGDTFVELRDDPTHAEVLGLASVTDTASLNMTMAGLCLDCREKDRRSGERVD